MRIRINESCYIVPTSVADTTYTFKYFERIVTLEQGCGAGAARSRPGPEPPGAVLFELEPEPEPEPLRQTQEDKYNVIWYCHHVITDK